MNTDEIKNEEEPKDNLGDSSETKSKDPKVKKPNKLVEFFKNPKKRLIFIISLCVVIILLFATGIYFLRYKPSKTETNNNQTGSKDEIAVSDTTKPTLYESVLSGVMIEDNAKANRHPLAVIVENHPDARPQSGLDKASVVYEAVAEGGITRFLALFGENDAEKVGPIRSVRTYFLDWAEGYSAFLAHVGGNIDALDRIKSETVYDLDQFRFSSPYWRQYSAGLSTEHTMYSSTDKLRTQAQTNGYPDSNNFTKYKFKDDPDLATRPEAQTVDVNFSSAQYDAKFIYDRNSNSYKRFLAGKPHTDSITKNQLNPKNIVVMNVSMTAIKTRINEQGYTMTDIGTGKARIYIDGKEIIGTWSKRSKDERETFYDAAGQEIVFNRGQLWICALPSTGSVTAQ